MCVIICKKSLLLIVTYIIWYCKSNKKIVTEEKEWAKILNCHKKNVILSRLMSKREAKAHYFSTTINNYFHDKADNVSAVTLFFIL